jgi:hypothetical protein
MGHFLAQLVGFLLYFGSILGLAFFTWQVNQLAAVVGVALWFIGLLMLGVISQLKAAETVRKKLELETKEVKP